MGRASAFLRIGVARRIALLIVLAVLAGAPIATTETAAIGLWLAQIAALALAYRSMDAEFRGIVAFSAAWLAGHTLFGLPRWPWPMVVSFALFAVILALSPNTRGLLARFHLGSLDRSGLIASGVFSLMAVTVLVLWSGAFGGEIHGRSFNFATLAAILTFALVNAAGEEIVWRFFAWEAARRIFIPVSAVIAAQAISFGVAHFYGVPSGWVGVGLAAAFGAALGWLRHHTRGLAAPVCVHVVADVAVGALAFS